MRINTALRTLLLLTLPLAARAGCLGSDSFYTCTDPGGNSYSVNQIGGATFMSGHNARTGTSWNQTTTRIGGSSFTNGTAGNGASWNSSSHDMGGGYRSIQGTDSRGQHFNALCGPLGCN